MTARPTKRDRTEPLTFPVRAGDLAYYDGFLAGLVPVRVLSIRRTVSFLGPTLEVVVQATAARKGYERGETFTVAHPDLHLAARDQVRRRRFSTVIIGRVKLVPDDETSRVTSPVTVAPDTTGGAS